MKVMGNRHLECCGNARLSKHFGNGSDRIVRIKRVGKISIACCYVKYILAENEIVFQRYGRDLRCYS